MKMRKKIVAVISSDQKFMVAGWGVGPGGGGGGVAECMSKGY